MPVERIDRPSAPRASSFEVAYCADPNCGPHILIYDRHNAIICEMVLSLEGCDSLAQDLRDFRLMKAVDMAGGGRA